MLHMRDLSSPLGALQVSEPPNALLTATVSQSVASKLSLTKEGGNNTNPCTRGDDKNGLLVSAVLGVQVKRNVLSDV
jgi:hypothetical protein